MLIQLKHSKLLSNITANMRQQLRYNTLRNLNLFESIITFQQPLITAQNIKTVIITKT